MQALITWAAVAVTLGAALALAGNRPVTWIFMSLAVCLLLAARLVRDIARAPDRASAPAGHGLWLPALLWLGVLAWGWVQTGPTPVAGWAHPLWAGTRALIGGEGAGSISADPLAGRQYLLRLASYGALFWIGMRGFADRDRAAAFLRVFALFSGALAAYGLAALVLGVNPILGVENTSAVVTASFVGRNAYASYAGLGLIANLAVYLEATASTAPPGDTRAQALRRFVERFFGGAWIFVLGAVLCGAAIALSQSRMGALAALFGVAVFLLATRGARAAGEHPDGAPPGTAWPMLLTVAAVLAFLLATSVSGLMDRVMFTSDEDGRFSVYPQIVAGILERPLLGHGLGGFEDAFRAALPFRAAFGDWREGHDSYLENAYELGLPAAAALYAALALVLWRLWRGTRIRRRDRVFPAVALACMAATGAHTLFDFPLQMPATAGLFALLLGMGWAQSFSHAPPQGPSRRHRRAAPDTPALPA
ncbi:O-antigen ligase family protein (plasmid) [Paroceanicella profunda]|uniref:O-antigen ligase family protein n=1 Tax=Paroceanicella profunda TaxID=2579971 RepID=A0A5B8FJU6_9RHOB|nr:O-antigen ligase family protein [Paroceanicella profunda]QDL94728.1 O-antigen ligase family protein [Paroceanicella profunda]